MASTQPTANEALKRVAQSVEDLRALLENGAGSSAGASGLQRVEEAYGRDADGHSRNAWVLAAVGVLAVVALAIAVVVVADQVDDTSTVAVIGAVGSVVGILGLAFGCFGIAKRQLLLASEARRMERQLSTIDPFIGNARTQSELAFRMGISHRFFPRVIGDSDPLRESAPLLPSDIAELLGRVNEKDDELPDA